MEVYFLLSLLTFLVGPPPLALLAPPPTRRRY
jgi:hypothetical protein